MPETTYTATTSSSEIGKALALRHAPNDRICVCCFTKNGDGKFHNEEHFVTGITAATQIIEANYDLAGAIWSNLQKLQAKAQSRSKETVEAYTHLLVDVDRRIKTRELKDADGTVLRDAKGKLLLEKINATEAERAVLLERTNKIAAFLREGEFGWGRGIMADSGNGYHLDWSIRPLDPKTGKELYSALLKVLAYKFQSPDVNMEIDVSMTNETRVITVWGTWNRKYSHSEERPQRQTRVLDSPKKMNPLSKSQIELKIGFENLVDDSPQAGANNANPDWPEVNPLWLEDYGVEHLLEWGLPYTPLEGESYEKDGETHYRLGNCITSSMGTDGFYEHHQGGNKRQTELILGKTLGYKCFSNDCDAFTIKDWLRSLQEWKGEKYPHRIFKDDTETLMGVFGAENAEGAAIVEPLEDPIPPTAEPPNPKEFEIVRTRNKDGSYTGMVGIMASDIQERPVEWLWKGRLPVGCGMVVSGPVAVNKSTVCTDFVARVTTGRDWPDGAKNLMGPRKVMICAAEDDWETTIKPRLMAAGADCSKIISFVTCFDSDANGKPVSRALQLEKDTRNLYNVMVAHPDLLMVVLDPLSGFYGDMDGNDSKRIRPMMQAVAKVCRRTRTAILMIIHENKKSDVNAVDKMLGSGAVSQVIRAGLRVSLNPRNKPDGRLMASIKNSMGKPSGGMYFEIGSRNLTSSKGETLEEICYIEWGERHDMSADDAMDDARALKESQAGLGGINPDGKTGIAMKIFSDALANGKRLHRDVHALLDVAEVAPETRKDAKRKLGVISSKSAPWYWWLPGKEEEASPTDVPETKMPNVEVM